MGTPFKMKGSPMQRNFGIGSPVTKKGIYKTFDEDGVEMKKRISREEANEIKDERTILETGADITVDKEVEIEHTGDDALYKKKVAAQKRKLALQKKDKASTNVKDLETGETISSAEDKKRQADLKKKKTT